MNKRIKNRVGKFGKIMIIGLFISLFLTLFLLFFGAEITSTTEITYPCGCSETSVNNIQFLFIIPFTLCGLFSLMLYVDVTMD